ncbi:hypothetical protein EK21DRAFT_95836 [Setomelanomma holmii]|uniref:N-acetyltransferase domain-containing protein n=1 Tax=Setomelanomma holmii TaxID=210430 RepID=A0A9P4HLM5_9PLEO|nr:hypothetical protein EK21DRAFT_95836 [Setomelanomma holmii]
MSRVWTVSEALPADSLAIATLFALSWTSPFEQLQFGRVDTSTLVSAMALRITRQMQLANMGFLVIRDPRTQEAVSVAQWSVHPEECAVSRETLEEFEEHQAFEDEIYRSNLPSDSNKDLIMEFSTGHYMVENLATHPDHRRKEFATRLLETISYRADAEKALVYLVTASDNDARAMYSRLGFAEQGRLTLKDIGRSVATQKCGMQDLTAMRLQRQSESPLFEPEKSTNVQHMYFDATAYLDNKIENAEAWREIAPYDPTQEDRPAAKVSVFRPGFIIQYLLNAIGILKRTKPNAELSHMEMRLKKLLSPTYSPAIIIGVRGLAGKGKTSVINAALSEIGLAHTSSGNVGTYVPVEYLALGDLPAPYAFEVRMFTLDQVKKCLRGLWEDYFQGALSDDRDDADDSDAVDLVKPARDTFLALFSDLPDFESEEKADAFLSQAKSVDDPRVVSKLLRWAQERYARLEQIASNQPFFTHTISDLTDLMEPYIQTAVSPHYEGQEAVGLESSRIHLAESYIKRCRITIVVDEIKRAGDNESLKQTLYEEIGDESSCKAPLQTDEQIMMSALKTHRAAMEQKAKKTNAQLKEPKNRKNQLLRQQQETRKSVTMEARSRQVKSNLRTWFRDNTGLKEPLNVFRVSTTHYMELLREDDNRSLMNLPEFTPGSTEIVALRRHLFTLVKKCGEKQSMINYYRQVKHLLNEMSLACTRFKPMYKRDHLLKFIQDTHDSFPDQCRRHRATFSRWLQPVLDASNTSLKDWLRKAEKSCEKWSHYNANSYWTFLKREGVHKRPTKNKEDWSRTLLDYGMDDLEPLLTALCSTGCSSYATELIQAFHEKMDDWILFSEFFDNMQLQNNAIEDHVRAMLSHQATSLKVKGSPFGRYMKETYISVMKAHPPRTGKAGIHNNRRAMFKNAIIDQASGPYLAIKQHIEVQANALLLAADSELKKMCDEIFDKICPVQEDDGFRALDRCKELKKDIDEAKRILEGPEKEALASAGIKVV